MERHLNDNVRPPARSSSKSFEDEYSEISAARRSMSVNVPAGEGMIDRMIRTTNPWVLFIALIVGGAFVTGLLSWVLWYWGSDLFQPAISDKISDQSFASYIGIIFGTAVALAGSFVAIMLAKRSVELSEFQNSLGERQSELAETQARQASRQAEEARDIAIRQTELAEESVRIADRQSPEMEAAIVAAEEYRRLKAMLITFPAILRKAQRDGAFENGQDVHNKLAILRTVIDPIADICRRFLESGAPSSIISLAKAVDHTLSSITVEERVVLQGQRYFEYATSSLYYDPAHLANYLAQSTNTGVFDPLLARDKYFRVLQGIYHFVNHADDLICSANQWLASNKVSLPDHDKRFAVQTLATAELNRHLTLYNDFTAFRWRILGQKTIAELGLHYGDLSKALHDKNKGGLVFSLHEAGFLELITKITDGHASGLQKPVLVRLDSMNWKEEADALGSDVVPIFLIVGAADQNLCALAEYLGTNPAKWPMRIAVIDQVEAASDSWTARKYLTMDDALRAWTAFVALDILLNEIFEFRFSDTVEDFVPFARSTIARHMPRLVSKWDISVFTGGGYHHDDLVAMCEATAAGIGVSLQTGEASFSLRVFGKLLTDLANNMNGFLQDASLQAFHARFHPDKEEYRNMRELVRELAKPPLVERPLYAFNAAHGGFMTGSRDLALPNTTLFGMLYLDSEFGLKGNMLTTLLASTGEGYCLF